MLIDSPLIMFPNSDTSNINENKYIESCNSVAWPEAVMKS